MARRSSARLRNRTSSTPQRDSFSEDAAAAMVPQTVPAKLPSLMECDELPGAFPKSVSPPSRESSLHTATRSSFSGLKTPTKAGPPKASQEEMHPSLHQQSTAKPLDEARHLGFSNMAPHTEPIKHTSKIAVLQATPTKSHGPATELQQPTFPFTFRREHSLELSPEAKKLMHEKREEVARIREQMRANGEGLQTVDEAIQRKLATPKSKKSRYSEVHVEQFAKMDSIAGHASAFRADPNHPAKLVVSTPSHTRFMQARTAPETLTKKSLKRSPSKAGLDEQDSTPTRTPARPILKLTSALRGTTPAVASVSKKVFFDAPATEEAQPSAKRVKRSQPDDTISAKSVVQGEKSQTPQKSHTAKAIHADFSRLAPPTQSSLARATTATSNNASRIPAPTATPSKALHQAPQASAAKSTDHARLANDSPITKAGPSPSTPLLARSPSKVSLFSSIKADKPDTMHTSLLARSPLKMGWKQNTVEVDGEPLEDSAKSQPLLSRSPIKPAPVKGDEAASSDAQSSTVPFLARTPAKFNISAATGAGTVLGDSNANGLTSRLELLRKSPVKSILRTPQRLYSDDPAKVAAGTHLATPPPRAGVPCQTQTSTKIPASAVKRVEFTSSTKAGEKHVERSQTTSPAKSPTPTSARRETPKVIFGAPTSLSTNSSTEITYPTLPPLDPASPSPQKRRQTGGPGDFTFRAGDSIVFGPVSPVRAKTTTPPSARPSIRHVLSELPPPPALPVPTAASAFPAPPATGSKKRKFEFENDRAAAAGDSGVASAELSDKENDPAPPRPLKRARPNTPQRPSPVPTAAAAAAATTASSRSRVVSAGAVAQSASSAKAAGPVVRKRPTLGVKPKKGSAPETTASGGAAARRAGGVISRARLDALSQPKRRA